MTATGCATAGIGAPGQRAERATPRELLRATVDSLINRPEFRTAEWGVLVVNPSSGDTLYAHRAATLMVPASNMKIVTAAVALTSLGPDFRYRTTFAARGAMGAGVLQGDLVVTGRGDPSVSNRMRGDAYGVMRAIADSLGARGVRRITGRVMSGADNFPDAPVGYGWEWDDLGESYGAGVDELLYNEGMSKVVVRGARGDSTAYDGPAGQPALAYLDVLVSALRERGIVVGGGVAESVAPRDSVTQDTLFTLVSPPLREILPALLKPSQNQIAEILLRTLALERTGVGAVDSGRAVVARQLDRWGVPRDGYIQHDGSGLARSDLLSPETLVRVLDRIQSDTAFAVFYNALPIAGIDGTIASRMRGTPAAGNVHAKTGSLQWVRSLSGYVTDAAGERLIFSILANKWTTPPSAVTRTADAIAASLAAYRPRL